MQAPCGLESLEEALLLTKVNWSELLVLSMCIVLFLSRV